MNPPSPPAAPARAEKTRRGAAGYVVRRSAAVWELHLHDDVTRRHAGHLVHGRDAGQHLAPAVAPQRNHALLQGLAANVARVDALHDLLADSIGGDEEFVN